jgi:hypothetical protein
MSAKQFSTVEVEGVLLIPGRMFGGRIEGIETVELGFDFWSFC